MESSPLSNEHDAGRFEGYQSAVAACLRDPALGVRAWGSGPIPATMTTRLAANNSTWTPTRGPRSRVQGPTIGPRAGGWKTASCPIARASLTSAAGSVVAGGRRSAE